MAEFAASKITKHLEIPVSLVTDTPDAVTSDVFDKVITLPNDATPSTKTFHDGAVEHKVIEWKNLSRCSAYNLTPYSKTLVIDTDYIINSSVLKPAFDRDHEFQIYKNSFDLSPWRNSKEFVRLNDYSIPFYWATAFIFEKNSTTESFFELLDYIKLNWTYFKQLYSINSNLFRNDFSFSIAIHMFNSMTNGDFALELPGTMSYITDKDSLLAIKDDAMQFLIQASKSSECNVIKTSGIDVHVMNKLSLMRAIDE
jgi:hypothetical protein